MRQINKLLYTFAYLVLLGIPTAILIYLINGDWNGKALLLVLLVTFCIGGVFDIWATRQGKKDKFFIWEYNASSILGIKIYGVPIEDFIFFLILTPVFIISAYEAAKKFSLSDSMFYKIAAVLTLFILIAYYMIYKHAIKSKK